MNRDTDSKHPDAMIERHFYAVGVHENCPNARYVGGTSVYVCECPNPPLKRPITHDATFEYSKRFGND